MSSVDTRGMMIDMDSDERCDLTELITTQCAHCRAPVRHPRFIEALFDTPGDDDDTIVATFPAQYSGRCADCDSRFSGGDWISRTAGGDYLCSGCVT